MRGMREKRQERECRCLSRDGAQISRNICEQIRRDSLYYEFCNSLIKKLKGMGVRLKNKFFNHKFVLAHHKLDMRKERAQD